MRNPFCFFSVVVMTMTSMHCFAESVWNSSGEGVGSGSIIGTFQINGGLSSATTRRTDYAAYSSGSCTGVVVSGSLYSTVGNSFTFRNPSTITANGTVLYNAVVVKVGSGGANTVQSIQVAPSYTSSPNLHLFAGTDFCFPVTVSGGAYVGTSTQTNITLQAN